MERLNSFHPNLKYTHEWSRESLNFLDVTVKIGKDNIFCTELYSKPTDCHQYLDYMSSHPRHIKESIIYSQGLRIKRLCSSDIECNKNLDSCQTWFMSRGYPSELVKRQLKSVKETSRETLLSGKNVERKVGVPVIITYPRLSNFGDFS